MLQLPAEPVPIFLLTDQHEGNGGCKRGGKRNVGGQEADNTERTLETGKCEIALFSLR